MSDAELFHYTTAQGLKGILTEQNIRATHYKHLNDQSELAILKPQIVEKFVTEVASVLEDEEARFPHIQPIDRPKYAYKEAEAIYKWIVAEGDRMHPIFIASMCRHSEDQQKQNGLLSQWRGYGASGGYCLVFDETKLRNLMESDSLPDSANLRANPVKYLSPSERADLTVLDGLGRAAFKSKLFDQAIAAAHSGEAVQNIGSLKVADADDKFQTALAAYAILFPFYKNNTFSEEKEFRIAVAVANASATMKKSIDLEIKFLARQNELVPYIDIFKQKVQLPIKRIIVGPGLDSARRKHGVEFLVSSLNQKIEVVSSGIPYV